MMISVLVLLFVVVYHTVISKVSHVEQYYVGSQNAPFREVMTSVLEPNFRLTAQIRVEDLLPETKKLLAFAWYRYNSDPTLGSSQKERWHRALKDIGFQTDYFKDGSEMFFDALSDFQKSQPDDTIMFVIQNTVRDYAVTTGIFEYIKRLPFVKVTEKDARGNSIVVEYRKYVGDINSYKNALKASFSTIQNKTKKTGEQQVKSLLLPPAAPQISPQQLDSLRQQKQLIQMQLKELEEQVKQQQLLAQSKPANEKARTLKMIQDTYEERKKPMEERLQFIQNQEVQQQQYIQNVQQFQQSQKPPSWVQPPLSYPQPPLSYPQPPLSYPQYPPSYPQYPPSYPQYPPSYPQRPPGY